MLKLFQIGNGGAFPKVADPSSSAAYQYTVPWWLQKIANSLTGTIAIASGLTAMQSLDAVTALGPGEVFNLQSARSCVALQVSCTGIPDAFLVDLEGSIDGTHWFTLTQTSKVAGEIVASYNVPVLWLRANLVSLSGGTLPTISAWLSAI